jgi:hypothetical protein
VRRPDHGHPAAGMGGSYTRLSELPQTYDPFSPDNQRRLCRERSRHEGVQLLHEFTEGVRDALVMWEPGAASGQGR